MPAVHVLQGSAADHERYLRRIVRLHQRTEWTVPRTAKAGDIGVFYLSAPVSGFVAWGILEQDAKRWEKRGDWTGRYFAKVGPLRAPRKPVPLSEARRAIKSWAYLKSAQGTVTVPSQHSDRLLELLKGVSRKPRESSFVEVSDVEGLTSEVRALRRSRSSRLRKVALQRAQGMCEVCRRDYSRLMQGQGIRVLQVHHKAQLSTHDEPRKTSLDDLAVVCANCHLLIHMNPRQPLAITELRRQLRR